MAFDALVHGRGRPQELPEDLEREISQLEGDFFVSRRKLKEIVSHFEEELREGLEAEGKNIPMNLTWVLGWPTGNEEGSYLALDVGGTNLRVCWITLKGRQIRPDSKQEQYKLPDEIRSGTADQLWGLVAEKLEDFIEKNNLKGTKEEPIPFGFTFSYPATQEYIDHGVLQTWTKGLDIDGVEGHDAAAQLREAMEKRNLPIKLVALINDTTGAMIASAYNDPSTIVGAIFGTGCNAAYMEDCASIPKLPSSVPRDSSLKMAINFEYGAFDNDHRVLPRTKYDKQIDQESPRPGEQTFEKLCAGHYLAEIFRLVLVDLQKSGKIFPDQPTQKLYEPYIIDTGFLSGIENDGSRRQTSTVRQFKQIFDIDITADELVVVKRLAVAIALRGARLCTCGVAAICKRKGITNGHVAADGSVANKHPKFKKRWSDAMAEVMDWSDSRRADPISITSAEDGSGIGAAITAAMTIERQKKGDKIGLSESMW